LNPSRNFWEELFGGLLSATPGEEIEMRLLRRGGQPFLLLPRQAKAAAAVFDLYPAQSAKARAIKTLFRQLARMGLAVGAESVAVKISPRDDFVTFLASVARTPAGITPVLGVLAGNPASPGQRFMIMLFNQDECPVAVVKAGLTEKAKELIAKETLFLESAPAGTLGLPRLRAKFQNNRLSALALDFCAGDSPRGNPPGPLSKLLSSWVNREKRIPCSEIKSWRALEQAVPKAVLAIAGLEKIRGHLVHPVLEHGDLAAWNVKVGEGEQWTVLDWERSQLEGTPGWDWFHYELQNAILVERLSGSDLVEAARGTLETPAFKAYAQLAGISGIEQQLMQAYLLHIVHVIQPSEGRAQAEDLWRGLAIKK